MNCGLPRPGLTAERDISSWPFVPGWAASQPYTQNRQASLWGPVPFHVPHQTVYTSPPHGILLICLPARELDHFEHNNVTIIYRIIWDQKTSAYIL